MPVDGDFAYYISGINFPCSKNDLINLAIKNGAPQNVISTLSRIPEVTYNSLDDVFLGVGEVS